MTESKFSQIRKIRRLSDRADSTIVSTVIIIPLFIGLLLTFVDMSIWFSNRSMVQDISRSGARTVAIFGGAGNATQLTPLEKAYGIGGACNDARAVNKNSIECNVLKRFDEGSGLTDVKIETVDCGPFQSDAVGRTTFCEVNWTYGGLTLSGMNFFAIGNGDKNFFYHNRTRTTSESEVNMTGIPMANR